MIHRKKTEVKFVRCEITQGLLFFSQQDTAKYGFDSFYEEGCEFTQLVTINNFLNPENYLMS